MRFYTILTLIISIMLFGIVACRSHQEEHQDSRDLLQELRAHIRQETHFIDFTKATDPGQHLLHGWAASEADYTWANADRSSLIFYRYTAHEDLSVEIVCRAFPSAENVEQDTTVFVNGTRIGAFTVAPNTFHTYHLTIPAAILHFGQNVLEFRFSYTTRPVQLDPNSQDARNLAVAFHHIAFQQHHAAAFIHEATQDLDFRSAAKPEAFLLSGWGIPENDRTWATARTSRVLFYAYRTTQDLDIELTSQAMPSPGHKRQEVEVVLNTRPIGSFAVKPNVFKRYSLTLPASGLHFGQNVLTFHFSYRVKPSEVTPNSQDTRNLSVAFQQIAFNKNANPKYFDGDGVLQTAGSGVSVISTLPKQFTLRLQYRRVNGAAPHIRFINDHLDPLDIALPPKSGKFEKTIVLKKKGIYQVRFITEGSPNSYTVWSQIRIDDFPEQQVTASSTKPVPSLNTYDVIYVVLDAFYAKHASLYGYFRKTTPFFEKLSRQAIVFDRMFANAPYTLASSGTLFTSKYPYEHGLYHMSRTLNPFMPTINELLSEADIDTYLITEHGFFTKNNAQSESWGLYRGFSKIFFFEKYSRHLDKLFEVFDNIYTSSPNTRKFLYIHLVPPHFPYSPPEKFRTFVPESEPDFLEPTKENLAKIDSGEVQVNKKQVEYIKSWYDSNVLFADHIAQQIFEYFTERGAIEKSIFVITSDHGEAFLQHGRMLHNSTVFDEMIHVPFIIRFPKEVGMPPKRIGQIASLIDVAPTLTAIYGLEENVDFSGKSLLPVIFDDVPVNPFVYSETIKAGSMTIRDVRYKYILSPEGPMLFDLSTDPSEQGNIITRLPVTAGYYSQLMLLFSTQQADASPEQGVDLDALDDRTIQNLKELGYIK